MQNQVRTKFSLSTASNNIIQERALKQLRLTGITGDHTATPGKILCDLIFLMTCQSQKSPNKAIYCTPGQAWLGQKNQRERKAVGRAARALELENMIVRTWRRRKKDQHWATILYRPGSKLWRIILTVAGVIKIAMRRKKKMESEKIDANLLNTDNIDPELVDLFDNLAAKSRARGLSWA